MATTRLIAPLLVIFVLLKESDQAVTHTSPYKCDHYRQSFETNLCFRDAIEPPILTEIVDSVSNCQTKCTQLADRSVVGKVDYKCEGFQVIPQENGNAICSLYSSSTLNVIDLFAMTNTPGCRIYQKIERTSQNGCVAIQFPYHFTWSGTEVSGYSTKEECIEGCLADSLCESADWDHNLGKCYYFDPSKKIYMLPTTNYITKSWKVCPGDCDCIPVYDTATVTTLLRWECKNPRYTYP
ncbi:unnamed protein product [Owenia fusiformis]|uniref:Uncharacterized protein n=1 Tax=Owenia fusiformis TaxID=6347 RepID=A0A8J1UBX7_OWEFU|nr:unnamed protein product [Owenia fusiformis]